MTEQQIETLIDGQLFNWTVAGDFKWGDGDALAVEHVDPLTAALGADGYRIVDLPPGVAEQVRQSAAGILGFKNAEDLERYHEMIDGETHTKLAKANVDLRMAALGLPGEELAALFGGILGLRLEVKIPQLGKDVVQLRIIRPGTTDYNPPHRDGALPHLRSTVNIWMPIVGVDPSSSLPILPGSQLIAERDCWQTEPSAARIGGRLYNVPAIARLREGPLKMVRAGARYGQALIFTPYLIHGLGANLNAGRTRMAIEFRFHIAG